MNIRRSTLGGGGSAICKETDHIPAVGTKKLFINAESIKPIIPWEKGQPAES